MGNRTIALAAGAMLLLGLIGHAIADPEPGSGSGDTGGDIEMEPDQVGSGSGSGSAAPATPEAITKDPKVAKKWLTTAQQLAQKGDYFAARNKPADAKVQYENAVTAYQNAIAASDDITVNYALGLVEDKLGATPDAYHHLKLVASAKEGVKPDLQKKAQAKLDDLGAKVGIVTLTIKPEGTSITIAGKVVGESPLTEPLVLLPGTYTASMSAAGYQPKDAEIKVEAGSEAERKIDLEPVPVTVKHQVFVAEPETTGPAKPSMTVLYIGAGATAAFAITATITGIAAISQHHAFTDPTFTNSERKDAQSTGRTLEHITDLCWVGAIASAGFTAYWYMYRYKPALDASPPSSQRIVPKVDMIPWVSPDGGGLSAAGSF